MSIKKNFILNLINVLSGLLFPLITFPYTSRILMPDGIGLVQFFQTIIGYIALCTALGIPIYAVREIARIKDNQIECNKITVEILLLHSCLTLIGYVIVVVLITTVAKIQVDIPLFSLLSANLFFSAIGALWFYQGIEDFKYITIRALVVRTLSLIALFIFVKEKTDLFYYAAISVLAEVGGNIFNFFRLRKFINFHNFRWRDLDLMRHFRPALKIFMLNIIISIYVNLDTVMLGFIRNETLVGYYDASVRITKAILGIVQALGTVLLPRFASLANNNQMQEFKALADKSISFIIGTSLPLMVGMIFMAPSLIFLFCGPLFAPSILAMQIMSPIILFIAISGMLGMRILYALGKENIVIYSTVIGAVINFLLNCFLIPSYGHYGAGIATSIAEFMVTIVMIILGWKYYSIHFFSKQNVTYYLATGTIILLLLFLLALFGDGNLFFILGILMSGDDCGDSAPIIENINNRGLHLKGIFITHSHFDHIYGLDSIIDEYPETPIYISALGKEGLYSDKLNLSRYSLCPYVFQHYSVMKELKEGDTVYLYGSAGVEVYETPGHDRSCLTYKFGNCLFTGDAFIPGLKVSASFPNSNKVSAELSRQRILSLSKGCRLYPGHGENYENFQPEVYL